MTILWKLSKEGKKYLSGPAQNKCEEIDLRLDYMLYILAVLLLIMTIVPFVFTIEGVTQETRILWAAITIVLGILSIGIGYSQRPKTEAQAC